MSKPIIKKIIPFDAGKDHEIFISWSGNRVYGNRIVIRDEKDPETVVFDDTAVSFSLAHTIPAGTLLNGREYSVQAVVFDKEGNPSSISAKTNFHTFNTPDFYFHNLRFL